MKIPYDRLPSISNSFITTLLKDLGEDLNSYTEDDKRIDLADVLSMYIVRKPESLTKSFDPGKFTVRDVFIALQAIYVKNNTSPWRSWYDDTIKSNIRNSLTRHSLFKDIETKSTTRIFAFDGVVKKQKTKRTNERLEYGKTEFAIKISRFIQMSNLRKRDSKGNDTNKPLTIMAACRRVTEREIKRCDIITFTPTVVLELLFKELNFNDFLIKEAFSLEGVNNFKSDISKHILQNSSLEIMEDPETGSKMYVNIAAIAKSTLRKVA